MCKTVFAIAVGAFAVTLSTPPASAQETPPPAKTEAKPTAAANEADMMAKMMELAQPGEHHRELAELAGDWDYTVKMSMTPGEALTEAGRGTAVRTAVMGGRYFIMNTTGKVLMPGADGKVSDADYQGMAVEGYDNVKQKFVSTWIDSMGTSILLSEGTYDAANKSFSYPFEIEIMPGMKMKAREVVKILDANHLQMDWYENHGGKETKTMEIAYTRKK